MDEEKKDCAFCNRETAMAVFGICLGLMFIVISVDLIRRTRMSPLAIDAEQE